MMLSAMDVYFFIGLFTLVIVRAQNDNELCFPQSFVFGVATASYQIEGAWNISGKGESIWDRYTHEHPERVFDHTTGDTADDSYHRFREDIHLVSNLKASYYRFSISWPRILPEGFANKINADGVRYYREVITELRARNIVPLITMYHWDLPQALQDLGGWTNPNIVDYFEDYAEILLETFGVSDINWITFNEPLSFCHDGYGGLDAPGANSSGLQDYLCAHNVLLAHGRVYRMFERRFKTDTGGQMGITLDIPWMEPNSTSEDDIAAAERARQFYFGWFAHPIFSKAGDYPPVMRYRIDEISARQGFLRSRLPHFTAQQKRMIRGAYDFMGVNHYTTNMVTRGRGKISSKPSFYDDVAVTLFQKPEWPTSNSTWLRVVPWGFRNALNWIKRTYDNPIVLITENGVSSPAGLHDVQRVQYITSYLKALHSAITYDGCAVIGYTYWSLLDNYEWMRGYSERFGLYEVDYSSPNRSRTPRLSAQFFEHVCRTGCIPTMAFDVACVEDNYVPQ